MLLDYAILTAPYPVQAGVPATLTLTISNGSSQIVTVTSIVVTLPIGTNAKDLTVSTGFQPDPPPEWNVSASGGILTLTPTGSGAVGQDGLALTIANVAVNDQPGTADLPIDETAAVGQGAPATNHTSLAVAKFPVQFSVSDLKVTPPQVPYGGSASVMWTGTPATYTLQYPGSGPLPTPVSNVGPFEATDLTIFPAVFTLTVSLKVPGQDQPVVTQKQATATQKPELHIGEFSANNPSVGGGDAIGFNWQVQLATSITLRLEDLPGSVDVTGLSGCLVSAPGSPALVVADASGRQLGTLTPPDPFPQFLNFVLTASDGTSSQQAPPFQVQVLPPTVDAFYISLFEFGEGDSSWTLSWSTSEAASVVIEPNFGGVELSGGQYLVQSSIPPQFGPYTIAVKGFGGLTASAPPAKWPR